MDVMMPSCARAANPAPSELRQRVGDNGDRAGGRCAVRRGRAGPRGRGDEPVL